MIDANLYLGILRFRQYFRNVVMKSPTLFLHEIRFQFKDHGECSGFHKADGVVIGNTTVDPYSPGGVSYNYIRFEPP